MAAEEPPWQQTISGNYQTVFEHFYWMVGLRAGSECSDRPTVILGGCVHPG